MSSPTAGNFDCARLQEIKTRLSVLVNPNEVAAAEYIPDIDALKMIKETQTSRFPDLEDPTKDHKYKAVWMADCDDDEPEDCDGNECSVSGPEIGTQCAEFDLTECFSKSFSVSERKGRELGPTWNFDEEVAINMAKKLKLMDEFWSKKGVQAMDAMAGTNLYTDRFSQSGGDTVIPAPAWSPDLFNYFTVVKNMNKLPSMKLFLAGTMQEALIKAELESGTEQGKANVRKVGQLGKVYSDYFLAQSVIGSKAAFLVSPSALAVVTKAYYSIYGAGMEGIADGKKTIYYTVTSPNSGITYDVIYQVACVAVNGTTDWVHSWKISTKGNVLTNPGFCNASRTGVLKFLCAA